MTQVGCTCREGTQDVNRPLRPDPDQAGRLLQPGLDGIDVVPDRRGAPESGVAAPGSGQRRVGNTALFADGIVSRAKCQRRNLFGSSRRFPNAKRNIAVARRRCSSDGRQTDCVRCAADNSADSASERKTDSGACSDSIDCGTGRRSARLTNGETDICSRCGQQACIKPGCSDAHIALRLCGQTKADNRGLVSENEP